MAVALVSGLCGRNNVEMLGRTAVFAIGRALTIASLALYKMGAVHRS
jgi:hypothetical protein